MPTTDDIIHQLATLGLAGRADAVQRYLRRVLRQLDGDPLSAALRKQLGLALVRAAHHATPMRAMSAPVDGGTYMPLLEARLGEEFDRPLFETSTASALAEIVQEHRKAESLAAIGLAPTRHLLLVGPPGVGKTLSAGFLASELNLPLIVLDLATVVSSLLGKTGQNLKAALEEARQQPCVLLLDEFDAIAKRRDDPTDVGELKRIVNVLLVELERERSHGLVVAATNHPELLDRAIERRFGRVLILPLPSKATRRALIASFFASAPDEMSATLLDWAADATQGESHAGIVRLCANVRRRVALETEPHPGIALFRAIHERAAEDGRRLPGGQPLRALSTYALTTLGLSYRDAADRLGVSHMTIARAVRTTSSPKPPRRQRKR